jgi:hypothetical protein
MKMEIKMFPVVNDTIKAIKYHELFNDKTEILDIIESQRRFWELDEEEAAYLVDKVSHLSVN